MAPPPYSDGLGSGYSPNPKFPKFDRDRDSRPLIQEILLRAQRLARTLWGFWQERGGKHMANALLLRAAVQVRRNMLMRRLLSFPHLLVLLWVVVMLWGERWVFHSRVEDCDWRNWESWPEGATPHHLIFVADPQLIDPHTYPGRPWPLSSLTVLVVDNYIRRSYTQLQLQLHPDTVFFLGDLFDGGREWKTAQGQFQDPGWGRRPKEEQKHAKTWNKKYGQGYWLREYARFGNMFFDRWNLAGVEPGVGQRGRKLIASLPGNHDLGFGDEIKIPVRNRFTAYFGEGNRVDVVGNHTFVSVDTVSLSASQSNPQGKGDLRDLYVPTQSFLDHVKSTKRKAVEKELRFLRGQVEEVQFRHLIEEVEQIDPGHMPRLDPGEGKAELPTVLLSHVPLYRPPGTPCGPMREHWPPAKPPKGQAEPVFPDDRNAISVSGGYQYQNVLDEKLSVALVEKIGNVIHAFSGDDHDYCELAHAPNQGSVREITVKSISMAMGVPTPGFQMVSLYNPIDEEGRPLPGSPETTLQTHLCLLPNQLATFTRYAALIVVCLIALTLRAFLVPILNLQPFALEPDVSNGPLLSTFKAKVEDYDGHTGPSTSSGSSASRLLSSRGTRDRSLSVKSNGSDSLPRPGTSPRAKRHGGRSPRWGPNGGPKIQIPSDGDELYDGGKSRGVWRPASAAAARAKGGLAVAVRELWTTVWRVAWMVVLFWSYLAYKG